MTGTIPRIVIAGTHSGCGKTTVSGGLMAALTERGLIVQPFKIGPDFIDPTHHTKICGRTSRNLDPFMMGEEGVAKTFRQACSGADIAVIEGVMGLFDGVDGTECASTAHVAKILRAPVILIADAGGMSRSIHALIDGYRNFDPGLPVAGVIVNRIGSPRHRRMIESSGPVAAVGWIPRQRAIAIKSRHLGLAMAHETGPVPELAEIIRLHCDLDAILQIARNAPPYPPADVQEPVIDPGFMARIGVAWDPAFCFYYHDNLERLKTGGAELVFFSPISDRLPDVDGIYLGGGYPELHLESLAASGCRTDIARAAGSGMPVYGECGGLMYLSSEIATDRTYRLCGVLPARAEMTGGVQALGYVTGRTVDGWGCLPSGLTVRGHEFHYSRVIPDPDARYAIVLQRGKGISGNRDGLFEGCTMGTYTHAYFTPDFARHFVSCCAGFRAGR